MGGKPTEFWIDVGGTFTDCLARDSDGALSRYKTLSSGKTKGNAAASSSRMEIVPIFDSGT